MGYLKEEEDFQEASVHSSGVLHGLVVVVWLTTLVSSFHTHAYPNQAWDQNRVEEAHMLHCTWQDLFESPVGVEIDVWLTILVVWARNQAQAQSSDRMGL